MRHGRRGHSARRRVPRTAGIDTGKTDRIGYKKEELWAIPYVSRGIAAFPKRRAPRSQMSLTARWTDYDSLRAYKMLFSHADEVHYSDAFYTSDCMLKRNRYMVGRADACVAYCLRNSGGTAYTVRRAEEKHIPVINLARGGWDKSEFEGFCKK